MNQYSRVLFFLIAISSCLLTAHQRSESHSKWVIVHGEERTIVNTVLTVKFSVLSRMNWYPQIKIGKQVSEHLLEAIRVGPECLLEEGPYITSLNKNGFMKVSWKQSCLNKPITITIGAFFIKDPMHSHVARFILDNKPIPEKLFTSDSRFWSEEENELMEEDSFKGSSIFEYLLLGIKHITTGYDHIAFLLGLLVLNQNIRSLLISVTGFTLGHSLTLFFAVMGFIKPASGFIEALIGYTIFFVALEFIAKKTKQFFFFSNFLLISWIFLILFLYSIGVDTFILGLTGIALFSVSYFWLSNRLRSNNIFFLITSIFGLVHGFGFGGYLAEIGLTNDRLLPALLGFNLGVEIGQISLIILFLIIMKILVTLDFKLKWSVQPLLASFLAGLGVYWFLIRIF